VIVLIWILENFLLAVTPHLFRHTNFPGLVLYSCLSVVLVGILVPALRVRAALLSGAVNMLQIGFRSTRRTAMAVSLTVLACYAFLASGIIPVGTLDRWEGGMLFVLLLPTGIAAVMTCWVLAGTHLQAYVRNDGAAVSVIAGVPVTAILFALSMSVIFSGPAPQDLSLSFFVLGCVAALVFFAIRDIYATSTVITSGLVVLLSPCTDPGYLTPASPVVVLCALITLGVLVGVHGYFSRHFTTVLLSKK